MQPSGNQTQRGPDRNVVGRVGAIAGTAVLRMRTNVVKTYGCTGHRPALSYTQIGQQPMS